MFLNIVIGENSAYLWFLDQGRKRGREAVYLGLVFGSGVRDRLVTLRNLHKEAQPGFESFCIPSGFPSERCKNFIVSWSPAHLFPVVLS